MSCPTCDDTLTMLGKVESGFRYFWCPRCGTLRRWKPEPVPVAPDDDAVPALVKRCREFEELLVGTAEHAEWKRLGIAEAINAPRSRAEAANERQNELLSS